MAACALVMPAVGPALASNRSVHWVEMRLRRWLTTGSMSDPLAPGKAVIYGGALADCTACRGGRKHCAVTAFVESTQAAHFLFIPGPAEVAMLHVFTCPQGHE